MYTSFTGASTGAISNRSRRGRQQAIPPTSEELREQAAKERNAVLHLDQRLMYNKIVVSDQV